MDLMELVVQVVLEVQLELEEDIVVEENMEVGVVLELELADLLIIGRISW